MILIGKPLLFLSLNSSFAFKDFRSMTAVLGPIVLKSMEHCIQSLAMPLDVKSLFGSEFLESSFFFFKPSLLWASVNILSQKQPWTLMSWVVISSWKLSWYQLSPVPRHPQDLNNWSLADPSFTEFSFWSAWGNGSCSKADARGMPPQSNFWKITVSFWCSYHHSHSP